MSYRIAHWVLVLAWILTGISARAAEAPTCTAGVWQEATQSARPDRTMVEGRSRSTTYCLLDGDLSLSEWRAIGPDGSVTFRGVGFRWIDPSGKIGRTLWIMVGDPGYTVVQHELDGSVRRSTGSGADDYGKFLERSTNTIAPNGDFRFEMDRSYDGGDFWISPFNIIDGTRVADTPPALPATLVEPFAESARAAAREEKRHAAGDRSFAILDGHAEVGLFREKHDGKTVHVVRFSSRYGKPARWRSVFWALGADDVTQVSTPLGR